MNLEKIAEPNGAIKSYFRTIIIMKILIFFNILLEICVSLQMIAHYDEKLPESKLHGSKSSSPGGKSSTNTVEVHHNGEVQKLVTSLTPHALNESAEKS